MWTMWYISDYAALYDSAGFVAMVEPAPCPAVERGTLKAARLCSDLSVFALLTIPPQPLLPPAPSLDSGCPVHPSALLVRQQRCLLPARGRRSPGSSTSESAPSQLVKCKQLTLPCLRLSRTLVAAEFPDQFRFVSNDTFEITMDEEQAIAALAPSFIFKR
jgi:hypothetical protein